MTTGECVLCALLLIAFGAACLGAVGWADEKKKADALGEDLARLKHVNEGLEAQIESLRQHRDNLLRQADELKAERDDHQLRAERHMRERDEQAAVVKRHEQGIAEQERVLNELQEKHNDALDLIESLRRDAGKLVGRVASAERVAREYSDEAAELKRERASLLQDLVALQRLADERDRLEGELAETRESLETALGDWEEARRQAEAQYLSLVTLRTRVIEAATEPDCRRPESGNQGEVDADE